MSKIFQNKFEVITFDCYGTLIDWEKGLRQAFRDIVSRQESPTIPTDIFSLYEEEERKIEKQPRYRSYRIVVSMAGLEAAKRSGLNLSKKQARLLPDQVPKWMPFPDTNASLERLSRTHELGILSNVDDDLLAGTLKHFTVQFTMIITAEKVHSYKPKRGHFDEARSVIGERNWLHVASSLYHDIQPAMKLGIDTVWVNRKNLDPTSEGVKPQNQVRSLAQLADQLRG
ncbi:MAG TPA: HAD hydrolase-like protein [Candidatus Bathyarchaeia archaeon]|nr:HAD hydrolase-like protein [Candidatus Bathyarchaeia archaeon]